MVKNSITISKNEISSVQRDIPVKEKRVTTGVALTPSLLGRLNAVAYKRKAQGKGRMSVSAVIVDVLEKYLDEYENNL